MAEGTKSQGNDAAHASEEYGFDEDRDPLNKDEAQAEASEYGLYGYSDEPGQAFDEQQEIHQEGQESEATAAQRYDEQHAGEEIAREQGGQEWDQSEHGAGFGQPMDSPQRHASHSSGPETDRG